MAREVFSSRFAFIAAAVGMAVGTGNIWRFPRVAAEWGGGTFLIALIIANLVWAIPILMAESLLGSKSRLGTVGAFRDFMGVKFAWMGGFMGLVTIGILFYYSVVVGWTLRYLIYAVSGSFAQGADTEVLWKGFLATPWQTILFHLLSIGVVGAIVIRGLKGGFEVILKYLIPVLFVILAILAIQALTLPGAGAGVAQLFVPDWARFGDAEMWLQAFTQMAFSTGAGWGLYLTYAVYMRRHEDYSLNAIAVCGGNLLASLLAGTAVITTLYALGTPEQIAGAQEGNNGLAFIFIPQLIGEMPGGTFFGIMFFFALFLAGVSSLIAMTELAARNVMDTGVSRRLAVLSVVGVTAVAGVPSAIWEPFLTNQDNAWGIGLLISGLLVAIAIMKFGVERARAAMDANSDIRVRIWWPLLIRLFPAFFAVLMGWWLWTAWSEANAWDPIQPFSIATLLLQWTIAAVVAFLLNDVLSRLVVPGPLSGAPETEEA